MAKQNNTFALTNMNKKELQLKNAQEKQIN